MGNGDRFHNFLDRLWHDADRNIDACEKADQRSDDCT